MPCIKCISEELRVLLLEEDEKNSKIVEGIAACSGDEFIEFEAGKGKKKREPSEYNKFIGGCMKGTGKAISVCAKEWKQVKAKAG